MYRVMIIDDDKTIREHLKEIIPWKELGLELLDVRPRQPGCFLL